MRERLKRLAEGALVRSGVPLLARRARRRDTIVLAYHNIVPIGAPTAGEESLHLSVRQFASQLEALANTHDVIPLEALGTEPTGARPRAVITFDDAYRGAITVGLDAVRRYGMPATVFIPPAFVGGRAFWWDRIGSARLGAEFRERALMDLAGRDGAIRSLQESEGLRDNELPDHALCASAEELVAALSFPGLTVGSHTMSHSNLSRLDPEEQRAELAQSLTWLTSRFANVIPWISYPYGFSTPGLAAMAAELGYQGGVVLGERWAREARTIHQVPRFNIPAGLTLDGFRLRVSGVISG